MEFLVFSPILGISSSFASNLSVGIIYPSLVDYILPPLRDPVYYPPPALVDIYIEYTLKNFLCLLSTPFD